MKTDFYTKAVLTVIAFLLLVDVCHQYMRPELKARAEGSFAGVQFAGKNSSFHLFDTRTGDVWWYTPSSGAMMELEHTKVPAPGQSAPGWAEVKKR